MSTVIAPMNSGEVLPRRVTRWLLVLVVAGTLILGVALVAGATTLFDVAVFVLFAGLWLVFAVALVTQPAAPRAAWCSLRARSMTVQLIGWVLFLPLIAALWLWSRSWPTAVRASLVAGIAFVNLMMFFPRP